MVYILMVHNTCAVLLLRVDNDSSVNICITNANFDNNELDH